MSHVLVRWEDNWADEMDVAGFRIYETADWETRKRVMKNYNFEFTICIGTNEEIEYDNGTALLNVMSETPLTSDEYASLIKVFGISNYSKACDFGETSPFDNGPCSLRQMYIED